MIGLIEQGYAVNSSQVSGTITTTTFTTVLSTSGRGIASINCQLNQAGSFLLVTVDGSSTTYSTYTSGQACFFTSVKFNSSILIQVKAPITSYNTYYNIKYGLGSII